MNRPHEQDPAAARSEQGLRLRAALAAARMGTWHWDIRANRQSLDESLSLLMGLPPGRTVGSLEEFLGLIHPEDRPEVAEGFRRSAEEGEPLSVEFRVPQPDRSVRWLRDQGDVVLGEDGRPQSLTGACVDITERKAVEQALRESEERLRRALEIETVGVIFFDPAGAITHANDAFLAMVGYTREDVAPGRLRWDELTPPEWMPASLRAVEEFRTAGRTTPYEKEYYRKDGTRWWALFAARRIGESEGVEFVLDVTERKVAEAALRQSEERLRLLVESARDYAIFTQDAERRVTSWNTGARAIFGYPEGEIIGQPADLLFVPEDRAAGAPEDEQRRAREQGRAEDERWHLRKDGSRFYASGVLTPLADGSAGCVKILRDLTERQAAEQALRELNASLERRVEERTRALRDHEGRLRALAAELSRTEQAERRRLSLVLHEHVQQLLVGAQMHLGIVAGESRDPDHQKSLRKAQDVIAEAVKTCRSLAVELSPPLLHEQGLSAALAWLCGRMRENYRLPVEFSSDGEAEAQGEELRELLFHATRELLLNVVKHAKAEKARVRLTRPEPGRVRVEVEDAGAGFDPQAADVEQRSRQSFGLFHIRERLRHVGGELEIDSEPGRGTRVRLTAPEAPAVPDLADPGGTQPGPAADPAGAGDGRPDGAAKVRVLIVDDHAIVREGLASVLNREPDVEVVGEAADGHVAVEVARDLRPDVVLMDVSLPGVNGVAATHQITMTLPGVRVVGLSAHEEEETARAMLAAGAVRYVTKGGPAAELVGAIREAVAGG